MYGMGPSVRGPLGMDAPAPANVRVDDNHDYLTGHARRFLEFIMMVQLENTTYAHCIDYYLFLQSRVLYF